jgi:hypothetical protein
MNRSEFKFGGWPWHATPMKRIFSRLVLIHAPGSLARLATALAVVQAYLYVCFSRARGRQL